VKFNPSELRNDAWGNPNGKDLKLDGGVKLTHKGYQKYDRKIGKSSLEEF
jgi:hypothetical protein